MKKILLLSNLGWMLVTMLIMANCTNNSNSANSICTDCPSDNFYGVEASKFVKGLARYRNFKWNAINKRDSAEINNGKPFEDARSCWYSIDTLKKFICLLEKYSQYVGSGIQHENLGIRFYYAAYDVSVNDTYQIKTISKDAQSTYTQPLGLYHTLFMVPTYHDKEVNLDIDFDPRASCGKTIEEINQHPVNPDQIVNPTAKDLFIWNKYLADSTSKLFILDHTSVTAKTPSVQNQGRLCPPNCPTSVFSTLSQSDLSFPDNVITKY